MEATDPTVRGGLTEAVVRAIDALVADRAAVLRRDGARAEALEEIRAGERLAEAVLRAGAASAQEDDRPVVAGTPLDGSAADSGADAGRTSASWVAVVRRIATGADRSAPSDRDAGGDPRSGAWPPRAAGVRAELVRCQASGDWFSALSAVQVVPGVTVQFDDAGRVAAVTAEGEWEWFQELMFQGGVLALDAFGSPTLFGMPGWGWVWYFGNRTETSDDWPFERGMDPGTIP